MTSLSPATLSSNAGYLPLFSTLDVTVVEETPSQPLSLDRLRLDGMDLGPQTDPSLAVTVGASLQELGLLARRPLVPDDLARRLPADDELVEAAIGVHRGRVFGAGLALLGLVAGVAAALLSTR